MLYRRGSTFSPLTVVKVDHLSNRNHFHLKNECMSQMTYPVGVQRVKGTLGDAARDIYIGLESRDWLRVYHTWLNVDRLIRLGVLRVFMYGISVACSWWHPRNISPSLFGTSGRLLQLLSRSWRGGYGEWTGLIVETAWREGEHKISCEYHNAYLYTYITCVVGEHQAMCHSPRFFFQPIAWSWASLSVLKSLKKFRGVQARYKICGYSMSIGVLHGTEE